MFESKYRINNFKFRHVTSVCVCVCVCVVHGNHNVVNLSSHIDVHTHAGTHFMTL